MEIDHCFVFSTQNANGYGLKQGEHLKERVLHASRPFAFKNFWKGKLLKGKSAL
jgi:hypothetical protein